MRDIRTISLLDIMPPSISGDEKVQAMAKAIDEELLKITGQLPNVILLNAIDTLPEAWLDELAWQLHIDFYDVTLPTDQKRAIIKNSDAWHRRKGTPSAVEELIQTIFGDGKVEEWFEYGGDPYHFRVVTTNSAATAEQADQFLAAINSVKNTRSVLDSIQISVTDDVTDYYGVVYHIGEFMTIRQVN